MSSSYTSYEISKEQSSVVYHDKKGRLTLKLSASAEIYLTNREAAILQYILQGYAAKKIGQILEISSRTVEAYVNTLEN